MFHLGRGVSSSCLPCNTCFVYLELEKVTQRRNGDIVPCLRKQNKTLVISEPKALNQTSSLSGGRTRDWKQNENCSAFYITTDTEIEFAPFLSRHSLK